MLHLFFKALQDPEPYTEEISGFGELRLYVEIDDSLDRKYHTITMRKPLMRITQYRHNSVTAKYAAIMECSSEEGNQKLRALESPKHDSWEEHRAPHGKATVKKIKDFIRRGLQSKIKEQTGDEVKIKGLSQFLPSGLGYNPGDVARVNGKPRDGDRRDQESSRVQGKPSGSLDVTNPAGSSVPVKVRKSAASGGADSIEKGHDTGGSGEREESGGNLAGQGREGPGSSRISAGTVTMRSWSESESGNVIVVLRAKYPVQGDVQFRPLSAGGQVEEGYTLPMLRVTAMEDGQGRHLDVNGNTVRDVVFAGNPPKATLRIELAENRRFRLGVM